MRRCYKKIGRPRPLENRATLREWLNYDPETGVFTWRKSHPRHFSAGAVAGHLMPLHGYIRINLYRVPYAAHRLAWLYMSDLPLPEVLDHINGQKDDNRWCNLRAADDSLNAQNVRKARKNSKTGVLGVTSNGRGYRAVVRLAGKNHYSTTFRTVDEASDAYLDMKRKLHEGCTI